ncbi:damage-control phosphatase ARMT1 family protein [Limnofasciculus baicalensis]|uniref:Damage-control phosphatase ARMT1 family protein n=1 Tax=Limnofasciculus baicalensis BBK-W-15 TaxID=2699891 RepID=A0AAE3GQV9_9CYAN|nr:ARMT1-like domain-containing protein [Limnofasciculus baicalensis]MCP2728198.1 damage-control phosphatase ARMT1 family protein [Limnofasciculus baicalensis BBK-W-15]
MKFLSNEPRLPVPSPLMMWEEGSFANVTLIDRWPTIIRRVIEENDFSPLIIENLDNIVREFPNGIVRSLKGDHGADLEAWAGYIEPWLGQRWIDVPWLFAEVYLYRRILEATGYFTPGNFQGIDPFASQKSSSLVKVIPSIQAMSTQVNRFVNSQENRVSAIALLYFALWGNRIDLSMWPEDAEEGDRSRIESDSQQANILVDDTAKIADKIAGFRGVRIDFIIDNAGFELFCDLCLADFLIDSGVAERVYFHLKPHPFFVSDAMIKDVDLTLSVLMNNSNSDVSSLGNRLTEHINQNRLICRDDFFWTSPLPFWEMPEDLRGELGQSELIFVKGDANYRRLLGDCQWSFTTPFEDIVCYFPAPMVSLRTLKAEIIAGLQENQVEDLNRRDPQWLINGEWGVIQFSD